MTTGQHTDILAHLLQELGISVDGGNAEAMVSGQGLDRLFSWCLRIVTKAIHSLSPRLLVVQGDTTTALAAAHAAFYLGVPVAHVEAGLRTNRLDAPFPEEFNRRSVAVVSCLHFSPTVRSMEALRAEDIPSDRIWVTGKTVIDSALYFASLPIPDETTQFLRNNSLMALMQGQRENPNVQVGLFTCHRRENHGELDGIIRSIDTLLQENPHLHLLLPVHPNPNVRTRFETHFRSTARMHLLPPLSYGTTITVLKSFADIVITDSGGLQEEATSFHRPVMVLREVTERPEGVEAGVATVVGTDSSRIVSTVNAILRNSDGVRDRMSRADSWPYGDGHASQIIGRAISEFIKRSRAEVPTAQLGSPRALGQCAAVSMQPPLPPNWRRSHKHFGGACRVDADLVDVTVLLMVTTVDHPFSAMWFENFELLMPCYRRMVVLMLRSDYNDIGYSIPSYAEIVLLDVPDFLTLPGENKTNNYFNQEYVKFTADRFLKEEDTMILFVETDAVFQKPAARECFMDSSKRIYFSSEPTFPMWVKGTQFALGPDVKLPYNYLIRRTPVLLHKSTLVEARDHIERVHKMPLELLIRKVFRPEFKWTQDNIMFSEFNILATYGAVFQPEQYVTIQFAGHETPELKKCGAHIFGKRHDVYGKLTSEFLLQVKSFTAKALCMMPKDSPSFIRIPSNCSAHV